MKGGRVSPCLIIPVLGKGRQKDKSKASLRDIESSRPAWDTQRKPISRQQNHPKALGDTKQKTRKKKATKDRDPRGYSLSQEQAGRDFSRECLEGTKPRIY